MLSLHRRLKLMGLMLMLSLGLLQSLPLNAASQPAIDTHAEVVAALQASSITQEAAERHPDQSLSLQRQRIAALKQQQRNGDAGVRAKLTQARMEFIVALAAEDTAYAQAIGVLRAALEETVSSEHGALALARFNAGDANAAIGTDKTNDPDWMSDLSLSYDEIGGALDHLGDTAGALLAYRKSLSISEALVAGDPDNTGWLSDLAVSHNNVGKVLARQGDTAAALAALRKDLEIAMALVARDPSDTDWQCDLAITYMDIGDALMDQDDGPAALDAYQKALVIREAVAALDPEDAEWQIDLSVTHNKIGNVLSRLDDPAGALAAFEKDLKIAQALVARAPYNARWQSELAVTYMDMGDALVDRGDAPAALDAYEKALKIREALVTLDPEDAEWQSDLTKTREQIDTLRAGPAK